MSLHYEAELSFHAELKENPN